MSTRLRITGLAVLIPGIILGLILAGQATPAMAEPPDEVKEFGLSLNLQQALPSPVLILAPTNEDGSSQTSNNRNYLRNNLQPPQQANTRQVNIQQGNAQQGGLPSVNSRNLSPPTFGWAGPGGDPTPPSVPRPSPYLDCNSAAINPFLDDDWPYPTGWKRDSVEGVNRDVGAYFHAGYYNGIASPANVICVRRVHTPGSQSVVCSQAPTWRSANLNPPVNLDEKRFTGHYTFSGQPICWDARGLQSHYNDEIESWRQS